VKLNIHKIPESYLLLNLNTCNIEC